MSSARGAADQFGRIGAVAVALGIGAALTTGGGVAWAEEAGAESSAESSSAAQSPASGSGSAAATGGQSADAPTRRAVRAGEGTRAARASGAREAATGAVSGDEDGDGDGNDVPPAPIPAVPEAAAPAAPAPDERPAAPAARDERSAPSATPASGGSFVPQPISPLAAQAVPAPAIAGESVTAPAAAPELRTLAAPVLTTAPVPAAPVAAAPRGLLSRLLGAVGLAPSGAGSAPAPPIATPALWALLGWTRREAVRPMGRTAPAPAVAPTAAVASAEAVPTAAVTPASLTSDHIGWVTGRANNRIPGLGWPQTNNTAWANVYGTDLGIMWFNGDNGLIQLAFGDTFSGPNMTGDWRNNILLLSDDTQLYDGLSLINTGPAFQFIPDARDAVFFIGSEVTNIPTAAVYANVTNYVNYMSVKSWDSPGRWTTNYSAVSQYNPGTDKWVLQRSTIRSAGWFRSSTRYRAGDQNFQQMAYVLQPESKVAEGEPRYVYAFGTPAGRQGSAFLSRVPEAAVTDLGQYEYWDGERWVLDRPAVAAPVIGDSDRSTGLFGIVRDIANDPGFFGGWFAGLTGAKTGGNVSEMSVQYNEYLGKYVAMYADGLNNVQLRTADTPEGPWSAPIRVASSITYPGLYAPFIHPLSGTGQLTDANGDPDLNTLYWNMSLWGNYNVVLMQTDLAPLNTTLV
jgi:hypothetical protein